MYDAQSPADSAATIRALAFADGEWEYSFATPRINWRLSLTLPRSASYSDARASADGASLPSGYSPDEQFLAKGEACAEDPGGAGVVAGWVF